MSSSDLCLWHKSDEDIKNEITDCGLRIADSVDKDYFEVQNSFKMIISWNP